MPTTIKFGKLFAKSPFKPVRKHMALASECAALLPAVMQAFFTGDRETLEEIRQTIGEQESAADKILEGLQRRLPAVTSMPLERRDLLDVLEMQEGIANRTQDIAGLLMDLPLEVPANLQQPMMRLIDRCVAATGGAYEIIKLIEKLSEGAFRGVQAEETLQLIQDVITMESEADSVSSEITRLLFAHCREMEPVSVVFLYQLVAWIDDLADFSEKLALRSQLLVTR
jgi:uncharacterized protein